MACPPQSHPTSSPAASTSLPPYLCRLASQVRQALGLTQVALAQTLGVHPQPVRGWEWDDPRYKMPTAVRLARKALLAQHRTDAEALTLQEE